MAAPQITSIDAPSTVAPGETFDVKVNASDPDSQSARVQTQVTDSQGNTATLDATISIQDPLTYALSDPDAVGWTITQDAADPSLFHVTAP